jgi:hypothetical protein
MTRRSDLLAARRLPSNSNRNTLGLAVMVAGALILSVVPLLLLVLALGGTETFQLPGTLVILSAAGGMALVLIGAVLRD